MNWVFKYISKCLGFFVFVAIWALVSGGVKAAEAEAAQPSAHQIVQDVTSQMLTVIRGHKDVLDKDPEKFYAEVQSVLDPVVDFRFIANGVMGIYAKQAAPEQRERFASVFKEGLVTTYAKGMAGFGDREITVIPPNGDMKTRRTVSVTQEVKGDDGNVNKVSYTMKRKNTGEWKLVNVVLNGVNLGKTFRSQFYQAMQKNGNDINTVITHWASNQ